MIDISCIGCSKKEHNESINDTEINKSSTTEEESNLTLSSA